MKLVEWTDGSGYKRRALIRDDDAIDVAIDGNGLSQDPPDINLLDWDNIRRELHNELVRRGLITYEDVMRQQTGVTASVKRAVTQRLLELYKQEAKNE